MNNLSARFALLLLAATAANAQVSLYYTNQESILRANLNGSDVIALVTGLSTPRGIAVTDNFIYWADSGDGIFRSNLNGSNVTQLAATGAQQLEVQGSYIYVQRAFTGIFRYDLDGTNETAIVNVGTDNGLAVTDSKIYFAHGSDLYASDLDGSNLTMLGSYAFSPRDVEVYDDRIYLSSSSESILASVNLVGGDLVTLADLVESNAFIDLAVYSGVVYAGNFIDDVVQSISINGGTLNTLIADTDDAGRPWGVAIGATSAVPEPANLALCFGLLVAGLHFTRRTRRTAPFCR